MRNLAVFIFSLMLTSLFSGAASAGPAVSKNWMRAHMAFLSSPLMEGRRSSSKTYAISASYVATQLQGIGLEPGGDAGSFYQDVTLLEATPANTTATLSLITDGTTARLSFPDEFLMGPDDVRDSTSVTAELVFVGYGIVAPTMGHDDYAGLDVDGRIVVALDGRPSAWPSEEAAHLGSGPEKRRHAVQRGAVGLITLHSPRKEKVSPYERSMTFTEVPRVKWQGRDGRVDGYHPELEGRAYLNTSAGRQLFAMAGRDIDAIFAADLNGEDIRGFNMGVSARMAREASHRSFSSPNVAGIIEGADPVLKHEYVVYTAHLDHLGIITNSEGVDEVYPGTMDNAAGVATLLETARVLHAEKDRLRRSVMFLALTAEESGLLGAGYFTHYPTVPMDSIVANVNLDMPYLGFRFADVIAFGAQHSSLEAVVAAAAGSEGVQLAPDPWPDEAIFVRSDHYRFVQQGVPAVMLATGLTSVDPDEDGEALYRAFLRERYHKPTDNLQQPIDYDAAARFARINADIGRRLATRADRPAWNEGDFFGELFAR